jgi:hypothetical protein
VREEQRSYTPIGGVLPNPLGIRPLAGGLCTQAGWRRCIEQHTSFQITELEIKTKSSFFCPC